MAGRSEKPGSEIRGAWERFLSEGALDREILRAEIAEAWQYCAGAGVNPLAGRSRRLLEEDELREMLVRHKELIDVARPFMKKLHQFVAGSGFVVLLADERGYVMEVIGDEETLARAGDVNFLPGACWRQDEVGNNGVGTALILGRAIQVSGEEHFCRKHHTWTCSGAPIFDQHQRIIGVLEMSGPVEKAHLHTLGMVVAAVEAISDQLRIQEQNREMVLLNNRLSNIYNTVSDGLMIIDAQGKVAQVNPAVEKILNQRERDISGRSVSDLVDHQDYIQALLESGREFSETELMITGIHCLVSGKVVRNKEDIISGGVLFVNPINKIKNLVNRFSGAQASFQFRDIIGKSKEMTRAINIASLAAASESNVMLEGESGTGKEVFAQAIHNASSRRNNPFLAVNCGAIPRELLGSELFGYAEGAFTGAKKGGRPGKFELASGGTIFLDEIGEMPLGKQVSLLRVLQERKVTRIGGDKLIDVDVRVICASNRNLQEEVRKGNFRRDLYYRLNVIAITLPPLREHREDIPLLFQHFLDDISRKLGADIPLVKPEVMRRLEEYDWPGNVRELQNVVERMVNISTGQTIDISHLPEEILAQGTNLNESAPPPLYSEPSISAERKRRKVQAAQEEREEIMALLVLHGGNISRVAENMGVSRNTLYRKLKQYEIEI